MILSLLFPLTFSTAVEDITWKYLPTEANKQNKLVIEQILIPFIQMWQTTSRMSNVLSNTFFTFMCCILSIITYIIFISWSAIKNTEWHRQVTALRTSGSAYVLCDVVVDHHTLEVLPSLSNEIMFLWA